MILLWARKDLFDTVLFMDADHLVLRNVDNLFEVCGGDGICAVNDQTQHKTWDLVSPTVALLAVSSSDEGRVISFKT